MLASDKTIIVNLKGGLGNQLFQYALGRKLAITSGSELKLDISGLDRANKVGDIYRPFALDAFSIKTPIATAEEIEKQKYPYGILSKLERRFRFKVLRQQHIGWEPGFLKKTGNMYLDGYFQSPKYFDDIREELLEELTPTKPFGQAAAKALGQIESCESVSIHIRRGDYISNAKVKASYGTCSLDYYRRATEEIKERVADPRWFVFSDDIAWAKSHLTLSGEIGYVSGDGITDAEELMLMAACKHNIIANSSFSWWGAWLNRNPSKVVVAPTPWFDTGKDYHRDLIPTVWLRIPKN